MRMHMRMCMCMRMCVPRYLAEGIWWTINGCYEDSVEYLGTQRVREGER